MPVDHWPEVGTVVYQTGKPYAWRTGVLTHIEPETRPQWQRMIDNPFTPCSTEEEARALCEERGYDPEHLPAEGSSWSIRSYTVFWYQTGEEKTFRWGITSLQSKIDEIKRSRKYKAGDPKALSDVHERELAIRRVKAAYKRYLAKGG